ncbi:MAG: XdhC/CoxI family protein [Deltaproteobacteria bacterium]|nr:XdhC/CoxI family protein [Deltaproteobacteria bacterium]
MPDIYEEIVKLKSEGQSGALVTITATQGSTPREVGAKMLVRADGTIFGTIGGGSLEGEVCRQALKAIREEKAQTLHFDLSAKESGNVGMICGGVLDVYVEPILPNSKIFIFGGGHISFFLARMGAMVGLPVAVVDDRAEFANRERFPEAEEVIAEEYSSAIRKLSVNKASDLVIVTRGHAYDQEVLEWALGTEARYIGMIGSRKKIQTVYGNLEQKGIPAEKLKRVHAPIGLDIGALTPEEIAVSILAEIIKVRRGMEDKK